MADLLGIDAPNHPDPAVAPGHPCDGGYNFSYRRKQATAAATSTETSIHIRCTAAAPPVTPDQGAPIDGGGVPCVN